MPRANSAAPWMRRIGGALLVVIVAFNLAAFVRYSVWLGLPEAAGAWLGTFAAVRRRR